MGYRHGVPDESNVETVPDAGSAGEPLSRWQRIAACVLGLSSAGAGGASVFVTTNQAGSVALLGVGAAFLIMAVNGTPIIRAKLKDYELTMAPKRQQVLEKVLSESPEEASRTLDVLQQIDPGARTDPAVNQAKAYVYKAEVYMAITRALEGTDIRAFSGYPNQDFDLAIRTRSNAINVNVNYTSYPDTLLSTSYVKRTYGNIQRTRGPLIVVTNHRLSNDITEEAKLVDPEGKFVQFVRWRDRQDDSALQLAVNRLLEAQNSQSASSPSSPDHP